MPMNAFAVSSPEQGRGKKTWRRSPRILGYRYLLLLEVVPLALSNSRFLGWNAISKIRGPGERPLNNVSPKAL